MQSVEMIPTQGPAVNSCTGLHRPYHPVMPLPYLTSTSRLFSGRQGEAWKDEEDGAFESKRYWNMMGGQERKRERLETPTAHVTQLTTSPGADLPSASISACWLGLKVKTGFLWILANDFFAMGAIVFLLCLQDVNSFFFNISNTQ